MQITMIKHFTVTRADTVNVPESSGKVKLPFSEAVGRAVTRDLDSLLRGDDVPQGAITKLVLQFNDDGI